MPVDVQREPVSALSCQLARSASTRLPRSLLQGPQVLVMTQPPRLCGGMCSSSVAGSPQIGQASKNRGLISSISLMSTARAQGGMPMSRVWPGRSIDMDCGVLRRIGRDYASAAAYGATTRRVGGSATVVEHGYAPRSACKTLFEARDDEVLLSGPVVYGRCSPLPELPRTKVPRSW